LPKDTAEVCASARDTAWKTNWCTARLSRKRTSILRVHVHIHQRRVQRERQRIGWITVAMQHILVGGTHGVGEQLVAHEAAVDVEVLAIGARLGGRGQAHEAVQAQRTGTLVERQAGIGEVVAEDMGAALGEFAHVPVIDRLAVVRERKTDIRTRQRNASHDLGAVAVFGLFGLEEFAPRRGVEIQVLYIDGGALCA
jgi:hypothetical protein